MAVPHSRPLVLVAAGALRRADGRVLLQRRVGGAHAGFWEFPGGKLEPGETPEAALVRELDEELGVRVDPRDLVPAGFASATAGERHLLLLLFLVDRWEGEPEPRVADALRWESPAAMAALPMPGPDYPLAARLAHEPDAGAGCRRPLCR